mmetsp:Transcript_31746/g.35574  ORF Transcript_31746/g.35574 Transcript_31746/m.35574 type:complete len:123 (+) Transcript_31746:3516-3884(+)
MTKILSFPPFVDGTDVYHSGNCCTRNVGKAQQRTIAYAAALLRQQRGMEASSLTLMIPDAVAVVVLLSLLSTQFATFTRSKYNLLMESITFYRIIHVMNILSVHLLEGMKSPTDRGMPCCTR